MPTGLSYGTVDCRILIAAPDTPADTDTRPDEIPPTGYVYLRARRSAIADTSATPMPTIVIPDLIPLVIDSEGFACVPDTAGTPTAKRSVELPVVEGMTWTVSFSLTIPAYPWQTGVERLRVKVDPFDIPVEAGKLTHIADYLPLGTDPSTGATFIKGDRGVSIVGATTSGGKLTIKLDDGTSLPPVDLPPSTVPGPAGPATKLTVASTTVGANETDAAVSISGAAPNQSLSFKVPRGAKGDKGDAGAGIPPGGTTGQIPARTASGGSEWKNAADLIPDATLQARGLLSPEMLSTYLIPVLYATPNPSPETIMRRDAEGQSAVANPTASTGKDAVNVDFLRTELGRTAMNTPTVLPAAANLNDYRTPGLYQQSTVANATLALNYPEASVGLLEVSGSDNFTWQTYSVRSDRDNRIYVRGRNPGVGAGTFVWTPWKLLGSAGSGSGLVDQAVAPLVIAHRGGASVHPEESMEAYADCAQTGFPLEMDVQFLKDGVMVACHDSTVDRTMEGATGAISNLTTADWKQARIKPIYKGGKSARPVFFEELLDQFGGQVLLVPEIKDAATTAQVAQAIKAVKDRGLDRHVLMQSFNYAACKQMAAAGLEVVYLINNTLPSTALATIKADGINWIGPGRGMTAANQKTLSDAGFKVVPYTVNSRKERNALDSSVFGYFSDDPWYVAERLQSDGVGRWTNGEAWPARRNIVNGTATNDLTVNTTDYPWIHGGTLYANLPGWNLQNMNISLEHLIGGPVTRPITIRAKFTFGRRAGSQGSNVGFTLYRNANDPEALFEDKAVPGQHGLTFAARRNGQLQGWEYVNGAAASALSNVTGTEIAPTDGMGSFELILELAASWIGFHCPTLGRSVTMSSAVSGSLIPMIRVVSTEAWISDIHVAPYIP